MHRSSITVVALAITLSSHTSAFAQAAKPAALAPAEGVCASLSFSITAAEKEMAALAAEAIGDNSAPRATLREMQIANEWAQVRLAVDLMRDHRCAMPKRIPSSFAYISNALVCSTARLQPSAPTQPAACVRANWKPAIE